MAPRITFPRTFTRSAKPSLVKESKGGPSGKEGSKLESTHKGAPSETAKVKTEAGEVKKERVTLRQLLDEARKEELEQAQKAKHPQPEVKEERKSAGSQSPESLRTFQQAPGARIKLRDSDMKTQALPTIPEKHESVIELERTRNAKGQIVYREFHRNYPVKPEGPKNEFGLSTIHENFVLADEKPLQNEPPKQKAKGPNFIQSFKSAMQGFFRPSAGPFARPPGD